ncbi:MAG: phenylacetate--CoA ligase family protein [Prevotella sp.]|nr:phenylacetate--CoA ligase family protein [Prevotella sp.]
MKTIELSEAQRLVAEGDKLSPDERQELQQQRLRELVAYAREKSPYLAKLYADLPENFTLTDLPIVYKKDLLENFDDYVTDRNIHMQDVLKYVDRPTDDTSLLLGQYSALKTSGSTGKPLPMVRDDYHNKIHGQMMGQRLMGGIPLEVLSLKHHHHASVIHLANGASSYTAFLRTKAAFPEMAHNLMGLSCLDSVNHLVEQLNEFQPTTITGYPSMLVPLAVEQMKGNLKLDVKMICTSSEMLTEKDYQALREAFHCPVLNNYCMTEGGEVAMTRGSSHLHINEDWVIVEPVDKDMNLLGESDEWSAGLLITDLTNYVQPIIRYYVSDVIRISRKPVDDCNLPCLEIRGRLFDNYTICGKTFGVVGLVTETEVWPHLLKYQYVQTADDTIQLRGLCSADSNPEEVLGGLSKHLKQFLSQHGCPDAKVEWSLEPFIPNKRGGKIPIYIKL